MTKPEKGMMCFRNQSNERRRKNAATKLDAKRKDLQLKEDDIVEALQRDSFQPLNGWTRRLTTLNAASTPGALDDLNNIDFDSVFDESATFDDSGDGVHSGVGIEMQRIESQPKRVVPKLRLQSSGRV